MRAGIPKDTGPHGQALLAADEPVDVPPMFGQSAEPW
jgi:hypothetical protein